MNSFQLIFQAIGTKWVIDIIHSSADISENNLLVLIKERIDKFDKTYSRFRDDSLITRMSQKAEVYTLPSDMFPMIRLYEKLYNLTKGSFTCFIGQVLSDAGYDKNYSLHSKDLKTPPSWKDTISYDNKTITLKKSALLDFGAAGKGYIIDIIGTLLQENNIDSFCIDAGGDILQKSNDKTILKVGLEHPENIKQVIGVANIQNQSICGSAGNRRKWKTFHHIIDPHSLSSVDTVLATWVVAETTMIADALSTCLFLVPAETLIKEYNFEYLILYPDYSIKKSADFPAEIFYNSSK